MSRKIMLITGVSYGLGKALAEEALRQDWRVVGTVWKEADHRRLAKPPQADSATELTVVFSLGLSLTPVV